MAFSSIELGNVSDAGNAKRGTARIGAWLMGYPLATLTDREITSKNGAMFFQIVRFVGWYGKGYAGLYLNR